eukprot:jgi/Mesvir1/24611/Mv21928-RA.1
MATFPLLGNATSSPNSEEAPSYPLPDYVISTPGRQLLVQYMNRKEAAKSLPAYQPLPPEMLARIRANMSAWFQGPGPHCGLWTRECARQNVEFGNLLGMDKEQRIAKQFLPLFPNGPPEDYERLFPDLAPGDLGACAFVGGGRNLLGMGRGRQIDAHDTVIHFTAPRRGHEADIGTRQDVVRHSGFERIAPARFYLYMHPASYFKDSTPDEQANFTYNGKPVIFISAYAIGPLVEPYTARHGKPHAGLRIALALLGSSLCTRLDLYGFSAKGSGHWWDPVDKQEVLGAKYIPGIGRQLFAEAMALGRACVYD